MTINKAITAITENCYLVSGIFLVWEMSIFCAAGRDSPNVKHKKSKNWWLNLIKFYKKYSQYLNCNVKRVHSVHLILTGIPSSLILFVNNRGWSGGFWLTDKIC